MGKAGNDYFRFKQFAVNHRGSAMKVGTDGVLLGAWAAVAGARRILDIGTGSGVIALMLAQRTSAECRIDAIDIAPREAAQANENVAASPWPEKVVVHHASLQHFSPGYTYDVIVSNPPYFINSSKPPAAERISVRHTTTLSHAELLAGVMALLEVNGRFSVILPDTEGRLFADHATSLGLSIARRCAFRPRSGSPAERWLLEFTRLPCETANEELVFLGSDNEWSDQYRALTRDFYLKL